VNFVTFDRPDVSYVEYGVTPTAMSMSSNASITLFVDSGKTQSKRYMHEASMLQLEPSTTYYYQLITSASTSSPLFNFTTIAHEAGYTQPLRIAMYGDFGLINDQSHNRLEAESLAGNLDLIIHAGDFAYNLADDEGTRGDKFMNKQQDFLAHSPMMVCAGNRTSLASPLFSIDDTHSLCSFVCDGW
jgi:phosphodiesterase/alkaline phosphatase D-like protein